MSCEKAEIFIPENWDYMIKSKGLKPSKPYSEEEMFFIAAHVKYRDLFQNYPSAILFIGKTHHIPALRDLVTSGNRIVEVLYDLLQRGLLYEEFTPVKDRETLERIKAYHEWRDNEGHPIKYRIAKGFPRGFSPPPDMNFKVCICTEPPEKRIILAVDKHLVDKLIVPYLKNNLGYSNIYLYVV